MIKFLNFLISKFVDFIVERPFVKNKITDKNAKKIIDLYSEVDYTKNFVKMRFWFGPLHEINALVPKKATVLDIGSGEGILANYLAISSSKRKITGIEISPHRVKHAGKGLKNIKFINGSVFSVKIPKSDVVVVSHVFHHLGSKALQEKLLKELYKKMKKKSRLIIAEVDRQWSLRYLFGYIVDIFLVPVFFEKKFLDLKIFHRPRSEWVKLLKDYGFEIDSVKNTSDRIYPEVILVALKK
jgi:2-polyprenyl-3-methyl-5-hydroxy-6-metoxy-1,4-benzoquinol methylase